MNSYGRAQCLRLNYVFMSIMFKTLSDLARSGMADVDGKAPAPEIWERSTNSETTSWISE